MKNRPRQYYVGYTSRGSVISTSLDKCKKLMDEEIENGFVTAQEMTICDERINGTAIFKWHDDAYYMVEYRKYIEDTFSKTQSFILNCDESSIIERHNGFFAPWRKTI